MPEPPMILPHEAMKEVDSSIVTTEGMGARMASPGQLEHSGKWIWGGEGGRDLGRGVVKVPL